MFDFKLSFGIKRFPTINFQGVLAVIRYELLVTKEWIYYSILGHVGIAFLFAILIKLTFVTNDLILIDNEAFSQLEKIMPGLVLFSVILNSFSNNGTGILYSNIVGNFEDMLVAPITSIEFCLAKLLFFLFFSTFVGFVTYLTLVPLGIKLMPVAILPMIISLSLSIIFFSLLGIYCGLICKKWDHYSVVEITLFPIIFFSGTVVPNSELPDFLSKLNYYNPLTNIFDIFRSSWLGQPSQFNLTLLALIFLLLSLLLTILIVRMLNKKLCIT